MRAEDLYCTLKESFQRLITEHHLEQEPANIGAVRYAVTVEDGAATREDLNAWADLILCIGSTICNGTITNYLDLETPVLFFGITAAGASRLMGWSRVCFADRYEA